MLYDEKIHLNWEYAYDSKKPDIWLQDIRDYIAGRTRELDQLVVRIEKQTEEIDRQAAERDYPGCIDCAQLEEVSRQLWSFIGPLIKDNTEKASAFRNGGELMLGGLHDLHADLMLRRLSGLCSAPSSRGRWVAATAATGAA